MTKPEDEEAAKKLEAWIANPVGDPPRVKIFTRAIIKKFNGDDTTGEPVETVEFKDPEFDAVAGIKPEEKPNATD